MNWTRFWRSAISLLNLICFVSVSLAGANPPLPAIDISAKYLEPSLETLRLPDEFAKIEDKFKGSGKDMVILVQDAHCNFDAQINIQKIIGALQETYGLKLVALEGGAGELDLLPLKAFPDAGVKERVLKEYASRGEISGAEMAAILNPADSTYIAIEDQAIYQENRKAFLEVDRKREGREKALDELRDKLNRVRETLWSPELIELDGKFQTHDRQGSDLIDYVRYLNDKAKALEVSADPYPAVSNLIRQFELEKGFDADGGLSKLALDFIRDAKDQIAPLLEGDKKTEFGSKMQAYQVGNISRLEFVKYLSRLADELKLQIENQESLKEVLGGFTELSEAQAPQFFEELESWTGAIKGKLFRSEGERALDKLYRHFRILERLSRLEATRKEISYYRSRKAEFTPDFFRDFLEKFKDTAGEFDFSDAEHFYELALARDEALFKNLRRVMKEKETSFAMAVAGGFHTEGFKRHLKDAGISYVVVTPRIHDIGDENNYLRVMRGEISYLNKKQLKKEMRLEIDRSDPRLVVEHLKQWRTAIINEALRKGKMAVAGEYTQYVDALFETLIAKTSASALAPEIIPLASPGARAEYIDSMDMDFLRGLAESLRDPSGAISVESLVPKIVDRFKALVGLQVPVADRTVEKFRNAIRQDIARLREQLPLLEALKRQNGEVTPDQFKAALLGDSGEPGVLAGLTEAPRTLPQVTNGDESLMLQLASRNKDQLRMVMTEYAERVLGIKDTQVLAEFDGLFKAAKVNSDEKRLAILRAALERQTGTRALPVAASLGAEANQPVDFFTILSNLKKVSPEDLKLFRTHFEMSGFKLNRLLNEHETHPFENADEQPRLAVLLNRMAAELKKRNMAIDTVDYSGRAEIFTSRFMKSLTTRESLYPLERAGEMIRKNTLEEEVLINLYRLNSLRESAWDQPTRQEYEYVLELLSRVGRHVNEDLREVMRREILWFIEVAKGKSKPEQKEILAPLLVFAYEASLIDPQVKLSNQKVWDAILGLGISPEKILSSLSFALPEKAASPEADSIPLEFPTVESLDGLKTSQDLKTNRNWEWDESSGSKREEIKERLAWLLKGGFIDYLKKQIASMYPEKKVDIERIVVRGSYLYGPIETIGTDIDTTIYLNGDTAGMPEVTHASFDISGAGLLPHDYRRPVDKLDAVIKTTSEGEGSRLGGITIWGSGFTIYGKDPAARRPPAENILSVSLRLLNSGVQHMRKQPFPRQDKALLVKYGKVVKRLSEGAKALQQINPAAGLRILDYYPSLIHYQQNVSSALPGMRQEYQREFERAMREGYYETLRAILKTAGTFDAKFALAYDAAALSVINGIDEVTYERGLLKTPPALYQELKAKVSSERRNRVQDLLENAVQSAPGGATAPVDGVSLGEEEIAYPPEHPLLKGLYGFMGPAAPDPGMRLLNTTHFGFLEDFVQNQSPYFDFTATELLSLVESLFNPAISQNLVSALTNFEITPSLEKVLRTKAFKSQEGVLLGLYFAYWLERMTGRMEEREYKLKYNVEAVEVSVTTRTLTARKENANPDAIVRSEENEGTYLAEFKSAKDTRSLSDLFATGKWKDQMRRYIEVVLTGKTKDEVYPQYVFSDLPDGVIMGLPDHLVDETQPGKERVTVQGRIQEWFSARVKEVRAQFAPEDIRDEFKTKDPELLIEFFPQPRLVAPTKTARVSGWLENRLAQRTGIDDAKWSEIRKALGRIRSNPTVLRGVSAKVGPMPSQQPAVRAAREVPAGLPRERLTPEQRLESEINDWANIVRGHFKVEDTKEIAKRPDESLKAAVERLNKLLAGTRHEQASVELEARKARNEISIYNQVLELEKMLFEIVDEAAVEVMRAYWTSRPWAERGKLRSPLQDMWKNDRDGTWLKLRQDWVTMTAQGASLEADQKPVISFADALDKYSGLEAVLSAAGISKYTDPQALNLQLESQQAALSSFDRKEPVGEDDELDLSAFMDPAAIKQEIQRLSDEIKRLQALMLEYPDTEFDQLRAVEKLPSKENFRTMARHPREIDFYQETDSGRTFSYLGQEGDATAPALYDLGRARQLSVTGHHHPGLRIPLPSYAYAAGTGFELFWGDLNFAWAAPFNFVAAGEGVVMYRIDARFQDKKREIWPLYQELDARRKLAEKGSPAERKSAREFFLENRELIRQMENFGLYLEYKDFEDSSWQGIEDWTASAPRVSGASMGEEILAKIRTEGMTATGVLLRHEFFNFFNKMDTSLFGLKTMKNKHAAFMQRFADAARGAAAFLEVFNPEKPGPFYLTDYFKTLSIRTDTTPGYKPDEGILLTPDQVNELNRAVNFAQIYNALRPLLTSLQKKADSVTGTLGESTPLANPADIQELDANYQVLKQAAQELIKRVEESGPSVVAEPGALPAAASLGLAGNHANWMNLTMLARLAEPRNQLSRRDFLKLAAAGGVYIALRPLDVFAAPLEATDVPKTFWPQLTPAERLRLAQVIDAKSVVAKTGVGVHPGTGLPYDVVLAHKKEGRLQQAAYANPSAAGFYMLFLAKIATGEVKVSWMTPDQAFKEIDKTLSSFEKVEKYRGYLYWLVFNEDPNSKEVKPAEDRVVSYWDNKNPTASLKAILGGFLKHPEVKVPYRLKERMDAFVDAQNPNDFYDPNFVDLESGKKGFMADIIDGRKKKAVTLGNLTSLYNEGTLGILLDAAEDPKLRPALENMRKPTGRYVTPDGKTITGPQSYFGATFQMGYRLLFFDENKLSPQGLGKANNNFIAIQMLEAKRLGIPALFTSTYSPFTMDRELYSPFRVYLEFGGPSALAEKHALAQAGSPSGNAFVLLQNPKVGFRLVDELYRNHPELMTEAGTLASIGRRNPGDPLLMSNTILTLDDFAELVALAGGASDWMESYLRSKRQWDNFEAYLKGIRYDFAAAELKDFSLDPKPERASYPIKDTEKVPQSVARDVLKPTDEVISLDTFGKIEARGSATLEIKGKDLILTYDLSREGSVAGVRIITDKLLNLSEYKKLFFTASSPDSKVPFPVRLQFNKEARPQSQILLEKILRVKPQEQKYQIGINLWGMDEVVFQLGRALLRNAGAPLKGVLRIRVPQLEKAKEAVESEDMLWDLSKPSGKSLGAEEERIAPAGEIPPVQESLFRPPPLRLRKGTAAEGIIAFSISAALFIGGLGGALWDSTRKTPERARLEERFATYQNAAPVEWGKDLSDGQGVHQQLKPIAFYNEDTKTVQMSGKNPLVGGSSDAGLRSTLQYLAHEVYHQKAEAYFGSPKSAINGELEEFFHIVEVLAKEAPTLSQEILDIIEMEQRLAPLNERMKGYRFEEVFGEFFSQIAEKAENPDSITQDLSSQGHGTTLQMGGTLANLRAKTALLMSGVNAGRYPQTQNALNEYFTKLSHPAGGEIGRSLGEKAPSQAAVTGQSLGNEAALAGGMESRVLPPEEADRIFGKALLSLFDEAEKLKTGKDHALALKIFGGALRTAVLKAYVDSKKNFGSYGSDVDGVLYDPQNPEAEIADTIKRRFYELASNIVKHEYHNLSPDYFDAVFTHETNLVLNRLSLEKISEGYRLTGPQGWLDDLAGPRKTLRLYFPPDMKVDTSAPGVQLSMSAILPLYALVELLMPGVFEMDDKSREHIKGLFMQWKALPDSEKPRIAASVIDAMEQKATFEGAYDFIRSMTWLPFDPLEFYEGTPQKEMLKRNDIWREPRGASLGAVAAGKAVPMTRNRLWLAEWAKHLGADGFLKRRGWFSGLAEYIAGSTENLRLVEIAASALHSNIVSLGQFELQAPWQQVAIEVIGQESVSLTGGNAPSLFKYLKPITVPIEGGGTATLASERHVVLMPSDTLKEGDVLMTQHAKICSYDAGQVITGDGKSLYLMSHQQYSAYLTLKVLDHLYSKNLIKAVDLVFVPSPRQSVDDIRNLLRQFEIDHPNLDMKFKIQTTYGNQRALTLQKSGSEGDWQVLNWSSRRILWEPDYTPIDFSVKTKPSLIYQGTAPVPSPGVRASSLGTDEQEAVDAVARIILNSTVDMEQAQGQKPDLLDIEKVRDPNQLAAFIVNFGSGFFSAINPVPEARDAFLVKILDRILADEKVNQTHYRDEYLQALRIAKEMGQAIRGFQIPSSLIWRPYDASKLRASLEAMKTVWTPGKAQVLPLDQIKVTSLGHGVQTTHTEEDDVQETGDLVDAGRILNGVVSEGKRLAEDAFRSMHYELAANITVVDPVRKTPRPALRGFYRSATAFRDLTQYPPFVSNVSAQESAAIFERYGVPEVVSEPRQKIEAARAKEAQARKNLDELKAAQAGQTAEGLKVEPGVIEKAAFDLSQAEAELLQANEEGITLNRLMKKFFRWLDTRLDQIDAIYESAVKTGTVPQEKGYAHPAVLLAAEAFNRLINIHPFENGNTRASWLVANYVLLRYGYPAFILSEENQKAFFNIERFSRFNREIYWDTYGHDIKTWMPIQNADEELAALFADEILKKGQITAASLGTQPAAPLDMEVVHPEIQPKPKKILFDFHGTLTDVNEIQEKAFGRLYRWIVLGKTDETGEDPEALRREFASGIDFARQTIGMGRLIREQITMLIGDALRTFSEADLRKVLADLNAQYKLSIDSNTVDLVTGFGRVYEIYLLQEIDRNPPPLKDGVVEFLDHLRDSKIQLTIGSGMVKSGVEQILEYWGIRHYFEEIHGADVTGTTSYPNGKNDMLNASQADMVIGDSAIDMKAKAGRPGVVVAAVGVHNHQSEAQEALRQAGADFLIPDLSRWKTYLGRLGLPPVIPSEFLDRAYFLAAQDAAQQGREVPTIRSIADALQLFNIIVNEQELSEHLNQKNGYLAADSQGQRQGNPVPADQSEIILTGTSGRNDVVALGEAVQAGAVARLPDLPIVHPENAPDVQKAKVQAELDRFQNIFEGQWRDEMKDPANFLTAYQAIITSVIETDEEGINGQGELTSEEWHALVAQILSKVPEEVEQSRQFFELRGEPKQEVRQRLAAEIQSLNDTYWRVASQDLAEPERSQALRQAGEDQRHEMERFIWDHLPQEIVQKHHSAAYLLEIFVANEKAKLPSLPYRDPPELLQYVRDSVRRSVIEFLEQSVIPDLRHPFIQREGNAAEIAEAEKLKLMTAVFATLFDFPWGMEQKRAEQRDVERALTEAYKTLMFDSTILAPNLKQMTPENVRDPAKKMNAYGVIDQIANTLESKITIIRSMYEQNPSGMLRGILEKALEAKIYYEQNVRSRLETGSYLFDLNDDAEARDRKKRAAVTSFERLFNIAILHIVLEKMGNSPQYGLSPVEWKYFLDEALSEDISAKSAAAAFFEEQYDSRETLRREKRDEVVQRAKEMADEMRTQFQEMKNYVEAGIQADGRNTERLLAEFVAREYLQGRESAKLFSMAMALYYYIYWKNGRKTRAPPVVLVVDPRHGIVTFNDWTQWQRQHPAIQATVDEGGGKTSHYSIDAAHKGIPAITGSKGRKGFRIGDIPAGAQVMVDGTTGTVYIHPALETRVRLYTLRDQLNLMRQFLTARAAEHVYVSGDRSYYFRIRDRQITHPFLVWPVLIFQSLFNFLYSSLRYLFRGLLPKFSLNFVKPHGFYNLGDIANTDEMAPASKKVLLSPIEESGVSGGGLFRIENIFLEETREGIQHSLEWMRDTFQKVMDSRFLEDRTEGALKGRMSFRLFDLQRDKIPDILLETIKDKADRENFIEQYPGVAFYLWQDGQGRRPFWDFGVMQIKALLLANQRSENRGKMNIMFPRVDNEIQAKQIRQMMEQARREIEMSEGEFKRDIKVGFMIESTEAIQNAAILMKLSDFVSAGTNDLTESLLKAQYLREKPDATPEDLSKVNRINPEYAAEFKELRPAMTRALWQIAQEADRQGKPVAICGELGGDPVTAFYVTAIRLKYGIEIYPVAGVRSSPRQREYMRRVSKQELLSHFNPLFRKLEQGKSLQESDLTGLRTLEAQVAERVKTSKEFIDFARRMAAEAAALGSAAQPESLEIEPVSPPISAASLGEAVFTKESKSVTLTKPVLGSLRDMTNLSRKWGVELEAAIRMEDGVAKEIVYPKDETKLAVVQSNSTDEIAVTENSDYYMRVYFNLYQIKALSEGIRHYQESGDPALQAQIPGLEAKRDKNLGFLFEGIKQYNVTVNLFSVGTRERYILNPDQPPPAAELFADIENLEYAVTTYFGAQSLKTSSEFERKEEGEYLYIHSHPIDVPSPPSAIPTPGGGLTGDIAMPGFFKGQIMGIIMDTPSGDELFMFYETDPNRQQAYIDLYNLYWYENGNPKGSSAVKWDESSRTYSRSVNESRVLPRLREEYAMKPQGGIPVLLNERITPPQGSSLGKEQDHFNHFVLSLINEKYGIPLAMEKFNKQEAQRALNFFFKAGKDREKMLDELERYVTAQLDQYARTLAEMPSGNKDFEALARRILFEGLGESRESVARILKSSDSKITDGQIQNFLAEIEGVVGTSAVASFAKSRDEKMVQAMKARPATPEEYEKAFNQLAKEKGLSINLLRPETAASNSNLAVAVHIDSLPPDLSEAVFHAMARRVGDHGQLFLIFSRESTEDQKIAARLLSYLTHEEKSKVSRLPYVGPLPVADIDRQLSKVEGARRVMIMPLPYLKEVGEKIMSMKSGRDTVLFEYDGKTPSFLAGPILSLIMSDSDAEALFKTFPDIVKKENLGNGFFFVSFDLQAFITLLNDRIAAERELQKAA